MVLSVVCGRVCSCAAYRSDTLCMFRSAFLSHAHVFLASADSAISYKLIIHSFVLPSLFFLNLHILLNLLLLITSLVTITLASLTLRINGSTEFFTYHPNYTSHFEHNPANQSTSSYFSSQI